MQDKKIILSCKGKNMNGLNSNMNKILEDGSSFFAMVRSFPARTKGEKI